MNIKLRITPDMDTRDCEHAQAIVDELVAALNALADDHGRLAQRVGLSENEARDSAVLNFKARAALAKAGAV